MGALTSTDRRGDDHPLYPPDPIRDRIKTHKSNKNRYSSMSRNSDRPMSWKTSVSMNQYPDVMSHYSDPPMSSKSSFSMISQYPDVRYHYSGRPLSSQSSVSMINQCPDFMSHNSDRPMSSKSPGSIINRYPNVMPPMKREVHAPYRSMKKQSGCKSTWRGVKQCYDWLHFDVLNPQRTVKKKGKEVINVDSEKNVRVEVSKDPGIEEIAPISGHRSVYNNNNVDVINLEESDEEALVSDQRSIDNNVDVINLEELDEKALVDPKLPLSWLNVEGLDSETSNHKYMENIENQMDSLSLNHSVDFDAVNEHKKLMRYATRVDSDLSSLKSGIDLDEKRLLDPENKPVKDIPQEAFVPLTKEENKEVSMALSSANRRRVLVTHRKSNIEITGEILQCLRPRAWLNDEVINVYMELLKEREIRDPEKFLQCHFFNTFFYKKLISGANGYDFKSVRRWTTQRKLGYSLVDCDKIFIPVHKEMHWCLAVINKKDEKFQYLDSLGGTDFEVFGNLARYFVDEVRDKSGKDIDLSSWHQEFVEDLPAQLNGSDCGMFMIKYADFYSRGGGLYFKQGDMKYFRHRTVKEILRLKAD